MPTPATIFILIAILADGQQSVAPKDFPTMEACITEGKAIMEEMRGGLDPRTPFVCASSRRNSDLRKLFSNHSLGTN